MESYQHELAKQVLAMWLRQSHHNKYDKSVGFGPFGWRTNRSEPHFGVWIEYPVSQSGSELESGGVWDENGWSEQLYGESETQETRPPTYEECLNLGIIPYVIFDLAIQHKGEIIYGIEIVHKNRISVSKIDKIKTLVARNPNFEVWATSATYIMHQVGVPKNPKEGFIFIDGGFQYFPS